MLCRNLSIWMQQSNNLITASGLMACSYSYIVCSFWNASWYHAASASHNDIVFWHSRSVHCCLLKFVTKEWNKDMNFCLICFMNVFSKMWCHDFRRCMEGSFWFSWRFYTWVWSRSYGFSEQICWSVTISHESGTVWIFIYYFLESDSSFFLKKNIVLWCFQVLC